MYMYFILGYYVTAMMGITTVTIAIQVLVLALYDHPPNKRPPRWIKRLLSVLHLNGNSYSTQAGNHGENISGYEMVRKDKENWPGSGGIKDGKIPNINKAQHVMFGRSIRHIKPIATPPGGKSGQQNIKDVERGFKPQNQENTLTGDIKYMARSVYEKEREQRIMNEWRNIAVDLDTLFFWVFLFILSFTVVLVLGIIPFMRSEPSMDGHSLGLYGTTTNV